MKLSHMAFIIAGGSLGTMASPAMATNLTMTSYGFLPGSVTDTLSTGQNVISGESVIGVVVNGVPKTLYSFCVDLYHEITLGAQNYAYHTAPLLTDSSGALSGTGAALTTLQIEEINGYAAAGYASLDPNVWAAAQNDIWDTLKPKVVVSAPTAVMDDMTKLTDHLVLGSAQATAIYADNGVPQGFLTVPEPASWALMIVGVGGLGATLRSRRRDSLQFASARA